jgi:YidC/Oxa1 family membrane protein insertase
MFGWLYRLLGSMLSFFERITGAYAIALVLYALIFKIVLLPFSIKQQKNQIAMAKLTPKIELIKAKYKGRTDQRTMQKQQQEIMELQQKEGYNPLSGCLPLLLQLPLIMLLFAVINNPLSYIAKPTDEYQNVDKNQIIISVNNLVSDENHQLPEDASSKDRRSISSTESTPTSTPTAKRVKRRSRLSALTTTPSPTSVLARQTFPISPLSKRDRSPCSHSFPSSRRVHSGYLCG